MFPKHEYGRFHKTGLQSRFGIVLLIYLGIPTIIRVIYAGVVKGNTRVHMVLNGNMTKIGVEIRYK